MGSKRGDDTQQQQQVQQEAPQIGGGDTGFSDMMNRQMQNRMMQLQQRLGRQQQFGQAMQGVTPWHQFAQQQLGGQGGFLGLLAQFQANQQQVSAQQAEIEALKKAQSPGPNSWMDTYNQQGS
jgi:hypothetical protein